MTEPKKTAKKAAPKKAEPKKTAKKTAPAGPARATAKKVAKKAAPAKGSPKGPASKKVAAKKPLAKLTRKTRTSLPPPAPTGVALRRAESRKLALELVLAALEKKAERAEIIDVGDRVDYADYIILLSGRSDVQLAAIAQSVEDAVKKHGRHPRQDGRRGASWIALDCEDVVVHVFLEEARKHYDIEGLWMDAPRVEVPRDVTPKSSGILAEDADG